MHINQVLRPCLCDGSNYFPAPAIDNLYFRFLQDKEATWIAPGLKAVCGHTASLKCIEIKGQLDQAEPFELIQEEEGLWLVFQYLGKSMVNIDYVHHLESATYLGLASQGNNAILQLDRGKTWLVLIGISGPRFLDLKEEYTKIAQLFAVDTKPDVRPKLIGYKQKRIFDKIQQFQDGAYSLPVTLAYQVNELLDLFDQELALIEKTADQQEVALYYRALAYIKEHFLNQKIPRKEIADQLCVHERTLTRAFEQKGLTISEMIQLVRLDKAREWIRNTEQPIDDIGSRLYFDDIALFEEAYFRLFRVRPNEDRSRQSAAKVDRF